MTGTNRLAYLADHKVDLLMSVGQTPAREKVLDFTQAYAPYYIAVFGPKAIEVKQAADLGGKSVADRRRDERRHQPDESGAGHRNDQAFRRSKQRDCRVSCGADTTDFAGGRRGCTRSRNASTNIDR